jgi:hypothetical protein
MVSTKQRKARKRAGTTYAKARKTPTARHGDVGGLGLITGPEIMARILARRSR